MLENALSEASTLEWTRTMSFFGPKGQEFGNKATVKFRLVVE